MIDRMRWLHVSDFHVVAAGDDFSQRVAMRSIIDDLRTRLTDGPPVRFVLVTGDIAYSGRAEEYERARAFFVDLAAVSRVPPDRFFFVPGNHDIDRTQHRLAWVGARSEITSQEAADRLLGNAEELSPLIGRQAMFWRFVRDFTGDQQREHTEDGLAYVAELLVGDELRLSIIGLNSPWLSGGDAEETRLVIGERQVINALELARAETAQLRIAMAHHPIGWLQEWDQMSCTQRLLAEVHFFHRGHLHRTEVSLTSSPERPCLSIAAGASHATRFYANAYNLVELDLGNASCTVRPFTYDPSATRYEASRSVEAPLVLHSSLPGTGDDLAGAIATSVPGAESYARYLSALLLGEKEEIPVRVDGIVDFLRPNVAAAARGSDVAPALAFLRLRNLLPLYGEGVPLFRRLEKHAVTISDFVAYLSQIATEDWRVNDRLTSGGGAGVTATSESSRLPHTMAFLEDLRVQAEWPVLEIQARRLVASPDEEVARLAKRALAEALMRSDEGEKRQEAALLGAELTSDPLASAGDFLLAAGCHESAHDDSAAVAVTEAGLLLWPNDPDLSRYARQLALRTGSSELRAAVERAAEGQ